MALLSLIPAFMTKAFHGLDIAFENARGVGKSGNRWSMLLSRCRCRVG
jgi:hypothetical protein